MNRLARPWETCTITWRRYVKLNLLRIGGAGFAVLMTLSWTVPAHGQSVPLLQSAETLKKSNYKLVVAPAYVLGKHGANGVFGLAGRAGYGFTDRFDAELKTAIYEHQTFFGGDAEYWLIKDAGVNLSMAAGLHWVFGSGNRYDTMGIELTPLASIAVQPGCDLYLGFNAAFEKISDAPANVDDTFTRTHLIPGIEYKLSENMDLAAEIGLGLNDNSWHYLSAGIEFYFR
jgi:hypothetical protein